MSKPTTTLRKPPTTDQLQRAKAPPRSRAARATLAPGDKAGRVVWTDGTEVRRMTFYLPPALATKLRVHCAEMGCSLSKAMEHIVSDALEPHEH